MDLWAETTPCLKASLFLPCCTSPDLRARDHKVITVRHGTGGERSQVAPRAELGEALTPDLFGTEDLTEIPRALLDSAAVHEHRSHHVDPHAVHLWWRSQAHALFGKNHLLHLRSAAATILFGPGQAYPAPVVQPFVPGHT